MPDFDVEVLSLASPTPAAPVTTYRPAVLVRNNGIHPSSITGQLRIYHRAPPGDLLATYPLSLANLPAKAEGQALATGYWIPTVADIGTEFLFAADITTEHDENEGNNHLSPVTVVVTPGEPPPPPAVTDHATQHEAGGQDTINVAGLLGELADDQPPKAHVSQHQAGGTDQINVGNLSGLLAESQTPKGHGDEAHTETYVTDEALVNHNASSNAHAVSTNLEHIVTKEQAGGYAGLDDHAMVLAARLGTNGELQANEKFLRGDRLWTFLPAPAYQAHAAEHAVTGSDAVNVDGLSGVLVDPQTPTAHADTHSPGAADPISELSSIPAIADKHGTGTHQHIAALDPPVTLDDFADISISGPCSIVAIALVEFAANLSTQTTIYGRAFWRVTTGAGTLDSNPTTVALAAMAAPHQNSSKIALAVIATFQIPAEETMTQLELLAECFDEQLTVQSLYTIVQKFPG